MVEILDEVITDPTPLWEDFVVGNFLDTAPHVAKVHMVLNKIWRYGDLSAKVEVYEVNATTMRFKISDQKAREKVLRRGMWNIVGVLMVVTKWAPEAEEEKQEEESIPMWIHLCKVPLHMFSWEGLSLIASHVGFPVKLHQETLACLNFDVAKVFVNVDVLKTLPKEMSVSKEGKEFTVEFEYPWLPSRCKMCNKWGHSDKVCAMKRKSKEKEVIGSSGGKEELGNKEIGSEGREVKSVVVTTHSEGMEELSQKMEEVNERSGESWLPVSMGKVGRSQMKTPPKEELEIQISALKFSVLSTNEEEEGEIVVQHKIMMK
ncbi:hypothetical protein Bca4012_020552 [Brassica carinata]